MVENNYAEEFKKIRGAFRKVKEEMNEILDYVYALERDKEEQKRVIFELNKKVEGLEEKNNSNLSNKECKDPQIVGNIESKRFHYQTCPYAKNIKSDNRIFFDSMEQAIKAGYSECSCVRE